MARLAVAFYFLESASSVWGQLLTIGGVVVSGDAGATANSILANEPVFRLAIAASLLAVVFHLFVAVLFYELFKPAGRSTSLLAVLFLVVACGVQAFAALLPVGALVVLGGTSPFSAFTVDELHAIALMLLNWNTQAYNTYLVFFGCWCIVIGYLTYRSTFLPPVLGVGMALAGLGYTVYSLSTAGAGRVPIQPGSRRWGARAPSVACLPWGEHGAMERTGSRASRGGPTRGWPLTCSRQFRDTGRRWRRAKSAGPRRPRQVRLERRAKSHGERIPS